MAQIIKTNNDMENDRLEYVTNAFHELKNPLTTIGIACDLIRTNEVGEFECDSYLDIVSNECRRMKNIIDATIKALKHNYFDVDFEDDLLGGVVSIETDGGLEYIPYYAWDNREAGKMKVWVPFR